MLPYNNCENKWLSKTKKSVEKHFDVNRDLYQGFVYIMILALSALAMITAFKIFS